MLKKKVNRDILYQETANSLDVDSETVKDVIESFERVVRNEITSYRLPSILISRFGTFKPSSSKLEYVRRKKIKKLANEVGNVDKLEEEIEYLTERIENIKNRKRKPNS